MDLITFWFQNEKIWFNSTEEDDLILKGLFMEELSKIPDIESIKDHVIGANKDELLRIILLSDQIARHIYRGNGDKIEEYHKIGLYTSNYILNNNIDHLYNHKERCFILLPLRHTFEESEIRRAITIVLSYLVHNKNSPYYHRFLNTSVVSLSNIITPNITIEPINDYITNDDIYEILDANSSRNLTEIVAIQRGEHYYKNLTLLAEGFIHNKSQDIFYNTFKKYLIEGSKYSTAIISISGGVDSMVSSYIMHHLSERYGIKIIGVMINYGNRDTCHMEVELVKRWCKLLNIDLYVRHIEYLKRDRKNGRDDYEKVTKKIRFDMYKKFGIETPVVLGHNQDDCVENIFTNIKKGRYSNLRGMNYVGYDEECTIIRPMLNIKKSDIISFAHFHKVPYLIDSTPSWSERGKIRDSLVPVINTFDSNIIPGLLNLADSVKILSTAFDNCTIPEFYKSGTLIGNSYYFECKKNEHKYGYDFWKSIFMLISKENDIHPPTNKSIRALVLCIESGLQKVKLDETYTYRYNDNEIIVSIKR